MSESQPEDISPGLRVIALMIHEDESFDLDTDMEPMETLWYLVRAQQVVLDLEDKEDDFHWEEDG